MTDGEIGILQDRLQRTEGELKFVSSLLKIRQRELDLERLRTDRLTKELTEARTGRREPGRIRIYLSGPMTGKPELNFPAFNEAARQLRSRGYEVVNPAELNPDQTTSWHECMRADIAALCTCDGLALLPGWEDSAGAHLELHIAHRIGLKIGSGHEWIMGEVACQSAT